MFGLMGLGALIGNLPDSYVRASLQVCKLRLPFDYTSYTKEPDRV